MAVDSFARTLAAGMTQIAKDIQSDMTNMEEEFTIAKAQVGTPLTAANAAAMTDHNKIYVYVGDPAETGYTTGNWYFWNGSAWESGGVYNSTALQTDTTLSIAGMAADAKVTGDDITDLKNAIFSILQKDATEIIASSLSPVDLNEYLTPGNYAIKTAQSSNNIQNGPVTGYGYRLLIFQTTAATRVVQIAFINSTPSSEIAELKMAIRNYTGTWSDWQFMASQSVVSAIQDVAQAALTAAAGVRKQIPNNTDYNTLTNPGNYFVSTGDSLATMTNIPEGVANHVLYVLNGPASITTYQIIVDNLNNIYIRGKLNDNSSFTNWCHLIKSDEFDEENGKIGDQWVQGRVLTTGAPTTVNYSIRKKIVLRGASSISAYDLQSDGKTPTIQAFFYTSDTTMDNSTYLSVVTLRNDAQNVPAGAVSAFITAMLGSTTETISPTHGNGVFIFLNGDTALNNILSGINSNYPAICAGQTRLIAENTNLNNITDTGTYTFPSGSLSTLSNIPSGAGRFVLYVLNGSGPTVTHQFLLDNYATLYHRMRLTATSAWQSWKILSKHDLPETIDYPVEWAMSGVAFNGFGSLEKSPSESYKVSEPIKLYAGDVVSFHAYFTAKRIAMMPFSDRWDRFWASVLGKSAGLMAATESKEQTLTATVTETGWYVFSGSISSSSYLHITRDYAQLDLVAENEKMSAWNYGSARHNVVDDTDAVPDVTPYKSVSVLAYSADNTVNTNHIVNAVAYPDGTIIACRAGSGQVVRIDNDGTETVLMTISNAKDWRGLYMDSRLNVYASPHSTYASTQMTRGDRGLYKLSYGGNSFTKVISLCRSTTDVTKWKANTAYSAGDIVFEDYSSAFYTCNESHTSGTAFSDDSSYWDAFSEWAASTSYSVGYIVIYNDMFFRCATAHTSGDSFDYSKWNAATEYMSNDDTIWTMCEDEVGYLYAGVYAHGDRTNAAVYTSRDGGDTWYYQHNFKMCETLPNSNYGQNAVRHVHCINFNPYDNTLYAAVGETNTLVKSTDRGETWEDMHVAAQYGQPTYVMGVRDGLLIGSDGHYACGVSKLLTDGKTVKRCGRTVPGFIFNIRRSDITGYLYAWTRTDNILDSVDECPPIDCVDDPEALEAWKTTMRTNNPHSLQYWENYNAFASKYYPDDAVRPTHSVIMISRDEGDTWEVFYKAQTSVNSAGFTGFVTCGYFRDGEILAGLLVSSNNPNEGDSTTSFTYPIVLSEGKKKRASDGYDLSGEIFIKTNSANTVAY